MQKLISNLLRFLLFSANVVLIYLEALITKIAFLSTFIVMISAVILGMSWSGGGFLILSYFVLIPSTLRLYNADKQAAIQGEWRVPEKELHILEMIGGWPTAFYAQRKHRHKITKSSYQFTFTLIVLSHALLWISLFFLKGHYCWISLVFLIAAQASMSKK